MGAIIIDDRDTLPTLKGITVKNHQLPCGQGFLLGQVGEALVRDLQGHGRVTPQKNARRA